MPLGFYYSQAQDWHDPNGAGNDWDFGPDDKKDFDRYLRAKAEPQVRELLTEYGPVALVWFDTPRLMTPERAQRFTDLVRPLQPKTLIDGRLGAAGDYVSTGDNVIPSKVGRRGLGDAGHDQPHLGLQEGRPRLEVARRRDLQAGRHRQQGRQLPAQRRADGRRGHPAAEPGHAARPSGGG